MEIVGKMLRLPPVPCGPGTDAVDADLSRYFDLIPHDELLRSVARRIVDRYVLGLIKLWLKAPIEERDDGEGPAHRWSQEQPARHASRRRREPDARQHLHEPVRFLKYWRLTDAAKRSAQTSSRMPTTSSGCRSSNPQTSKCCPNCYPEAIRSKKTMK